jgi:predicted nucleic acid-binding protein
MIVLIDTNILLDVLQKRPPYYDYSSRVWSLVEQKAVVGYVSIISFNNIFYILRKQVGAIQALEGVKVTRAIFTCVPFDEQALDRAIVAPTRDFEDAIQAAASARVNADLIVTRNVKDFVGLGVHAVSPDEFLALFRIRQS